MIKRRAESEVSRLSHSVCELISTGSTLLDLCISGKRYPKGGIPGGIIVEIFGPASSGKTAILSELCASAQARKGSVMYLDPEGRLDQEYSKIYGMELNKEDYHMPDTVVEAFEKLRNWEPKEGKAVNIIATDSLAALSTDLEMDKGDKMGMKRAKDFSAELRKTARIIKNRNCILACSNQMREGERGTFTPGGQAIPYYSSLRIRVTQKELVEREVKLNSGVKISKAIGIRSECYIKKSTVDDPFRTCSIYILFNYGIDDIRGNLHYLKSMTGDTMFTCADGKRFIGIEQAIRHTESNNLADDLKKSVIKLWNAAEEAFKCSRSAKSRE